MDSRDKKNEMEQIQRGLEAFLNSELKGTEDGEKYPEEERGKAEYADAKYWEDEGFVKEYPGTGGSEENGSNERDIKVIHFGQEASGDFRRNDWEDTDTETEAVDWDLAEKRPGTAVRQDAGRGTSGGQYQGSGARESRRIQSPPGNPAGRQRQGTEAGGSPRRIQPPPGNPTGGQYRRTEAGGSPRRIQPPPGNPTGGQYRRMEAGPSQRAQQSHERAADRRQPQEYAGDIRPPFDSSPDRTRSRRCLVSVQQPQEASAAGIPSAGYSEEAAEPQKRLSGKNNQKRGGSGEKVTGTQGENDGVMEEKKSKKKKAKKKKSRLKSALCRLLIAAVLIISLLGFGLYQLVGLAYGKMTFREIASLADMPMKEEGVVNILLIGNDSRQNGEDGRSDAMILLSISNRTKTIYMTSLLRDMYVEIPGYNGNRLNAAYSFGGAELLMETIKENFDIPVNRYVSVNFEAFANLVDAVGGIELELTSEEIEYVNGYLVEYNMLTNRPQGTDNMDTSVSGLVHLNGPQALAYSRNRYLGTDFGRTERQRKVLTAVIGKAPGALLTNAGGLLDGLMPNLTTNLTQQECFRLSLMAGKLLSYDIISDSLPQPGTYENVYIREMAVLQVDFDTNVRYLKEKIYGE